MLQPLLAGMRQALEAMTPADRQRMREMLQELNRMLRERAAGAEPDFEAFRARWGEQFPGVESLDQLIAHLARQVGQMCSLLARMSPAQQGQLEAMMQSLLLQDERLDAALRQLAAGLAAVAPLDELRRRYEFRGDDRLSLDEAMKLMETLGQMDELERQLRRDQTPEDLARVDQKAAAPALGDESVSGL